MYVCVCFGVTDRQVDAAIDAGHSCADAVAAATGAGTGCGMCRETVCDLVAAKRTSNPERNPAAVPA